MYSLGLNNPPRIGLTPVKLRIEKKWCIKQGDCRCNMAGTGFHSVVANRAKMWTADHGIPWYIVDCHEENNHIPRVVTVKSTTFESRLPRGYSCCGKTRYIWERIAKVLFQLWQTAVLESVCHNRVKSSTSHFTSTVPLFVVPYVFDARLYTCKTHTWQIV
jgi:hypothetical protein